VHDADFSDPLLWFVMAVLAAECLLHSGAPFESVGVVGEWRDTLKRYWGQVR
jgi:hypothetical protein